MMAHRKEGVPRVVGFDRKSTSSPGMVDFGGCGGMSCLCRPGMAGAPSVRATRGKGGRRPGHPTGSYRTFHIRQGCQTRERSDDSCQTYRKSLRSVIALWRLRKCQKGRRLERFPPEKETTKTRAFGTGRRVSGSRILRLYTNKVSA